MHEWALLHHWLCNQKHPWGICSCSPIVNFLKVTFYHGMVTLVIFLIKNNLNRHIKHENHHHHHYCSLYLRNNQKIWITTKIHIFTKGFEHIECGRFLRDHAGFHEHKEPRVVLYKLSHDIINSHKVTKHACTFSCLPLATQYTTYTITLQ